MIDGEQRDGLDGQLQTAEQTLARHLTVLALGVDQQQQRGEEQELGAAVLGAVLDEEDADQRRVLAQTEAERAQQRDKDATRPFALQVAARVARAQELM